MGLLALSDFLSEIGAIVGNRTDLTAGRIINALNFAQDKISQAQDFKELETLQTTATNYTGNPASDKYLPVPGNWKTVHSIVCQYGIDSRKLKNIPWRKFDRMYPMPEAVAAYIPIIYTHWNQKLVFMPVPNAVYVLNARVTTYPVKFTSSSALTQTSQFYGKDDILTAFAAGYLWNSFGRYDKATEFYNQAQALLEVAMRADSNRPDLDTAGSADDTYGVSGAYWANPWITSVSDSQ